MKYMLWKIHCALFSDKTTKSFSGLLIDNLNSVLKPLCLFLLCIFLRMSLFSKDTFIIVFISNSNKYFRRTSCVPRLVNIDNRSVVFCVGRKVLQSCLVVLLCHLRLNLYCNRKTFNETTSLFISLSVLWCVCKYREF